MFGCDAYHLVSELWVRRRILGTLANSGYARETSSAVYPFVGVALAEWVLMNDERVEGMSGKPPRLLLVDVNQVDHVASVHPLVESHGGGSLFDELH